MFWSQKKDDDTEGSSVRQRKLKPELQKLIDQEEEFFDELYEGRYGQSAD